MSQPDLPAELQLDYQPTLRADFPGAIGLIACGEITKYHLEAYQKLGYPVVALCDIDRSKAERRLEFFPQASVVTDFRAVLDNSNVTVVDVATHPSERGEIIQAALEAGKHVLSQKPFVQDLREGRRLVDLAKNCNRKLAINQNARWAPHFGYALKAVAAGLIGRLHAIRFHLHWDHTWTRTTKFAEIRHLMLYDFAIHWFDLIMALMPQRPWNSVTANVASTAGQNMMPPLLAQATVQFSDAQASLCLDGDAQYFPLNQTYLAGSAGSIYSTGPDYSQQKVNIANAAGVFQVPLDGGWFPDGFGGSMTELASSILADREPENSAEGNLDSLALCFAAMVAADQGRRVVPGEVESAPM